MINNVIFDLGNVILNFKPYKFLRKKYDKKLSDRLYQEIFQSKEWILLDKGVLSQKEVVNRLTKRYPADAKEIMDIFNVWTEMLKPIPGSVEILNKLHSQGYMLYVLSNFHIKAFKQVFNENNFFDCFDGLIISAEVKKIKPEAGIYRELIDRFKIIPEESVFIDDTEDNLIGAEKFGINTIQFLSSSSLNRKLNELGIEI